MPAREPAAAEPPFVSRLLRSHGHMRFRHGVFRAPRQGPGTPPPLGPARAGPPSSALPPAPPARGPAAYLRDPSPGASLPGRSGRAALLRWPPVFSELRVEPSIGAWRVQYPDINGGPPVSPTPDNTKGAKSGAFLPDGSLCGKCMVVKYRTPFLSFHGVAEQHQASLLPHPDSHKQKETKLSHPGRPPQTT